MKEMMIPYILIVWSLFATGALKKSLKNYTWAAIGGFTILTVLAVISRLWAPVDLTNSTTVKAPHAVMSPVFGQQIDEIYVDHNQLVKENDVLYTLVDINSTADKAKIDAELAANQAPPISDARLKLIAQALVMATVNHYDEPSRITLLDLSRPENIVNGQILGIRRKKSGIIGRVKIDRIQNGQAFADPIPESFFGKPVDIRVGDELIVIP